MQSFWILLTLHTYMYFNPKKGKTLLISQEYISEKMYMLDLKEAFIFYTSPKFVCILKNAVKRYPGVF